MTDTAADAAADMIIIDDCPAGIPAGEFMKPDPALTRVETRHYLMGELARYLKVLATAASTTAATAATATAEGAGEGSEGEGPVSRMARLHRLLQADGKLPEGSVSEQMTHVGKWIFSVIQTSLTIGLPASGVTEYETLALAFWNVDLLPCGKTIGSFWNYSPFEALRTAPPLTDAAVDDYSDMPGLISLEELARQTFAPDALPPLIPIDAADTIQQVQSGDAEEEEEYVAYNRMPVLPQSVVDRIGGAVEAVFDFALRPVTIPVWGIALALAAIPPLFMTKC